MKIWIDISVPPHVNFFRPFIKRFEDDVIVTARDFSTIKESLDRLGIEHALIGTHGKTKKEKMIKSCERTKRLTKLISKEKPDIGLSKHSVECPRVCFGLGIPNISVLDHETAEIQNRLIIPLSDVLITPSFIPEECLRSFGAKRIVQFYGVCEYVNNIGFKPSKQVLKELGLTKNNPIIISRAEPYLCSHSHNESNMFGILRDLSDVDSQIIFLPRNDIDKKQFSKLDIIVPEKEIDTLSLYKFADLMVGAGCTMNREACLVGCPTVSTYPDELPAVNKFLIRKGLMKHSVDKNQAVKWCVEFLNNGEIEKNKLENVIQKFENPHEKIIEEIERLK